MKRRFYSLFFSMSSKTDVSRRESDWLCEAHKPPYESGKFAINENEFNTGA